MARVFLSYDREDEPRARIIATALERSGHSVWWDRQIKGGHEFSAEIEAELDAADKIVVLWSDRAVKSAWVRDEAAVGRDTGRLVPVTLDGTSPPLGFRQFQTIDLSQMRRGGSSPQLKALVDAIDAPDVPTPGARSNGRRSSGRLPRALLLSVGVILIMAVAAVSIAWLWTTRGANEQVRVTIAAEDRSALSREAAHDLMVGLGGLTDEASSSYQIIDAADGRSARADLTLGVAAATRNDREHRELSLRSADGDILWSASIDQPSPASANLARQLSVQAQRALSCAAEALTDRRERLRGETLRLYVPSCSNYDSAYGVNVDASERAKQFELVIAKAPRFEPAWAKLLMSEVGNIQQVDDEKALRRTIGAQISDAQKLGLDFGELYVAKAETFVPNDFLDIFRAYDEGIKRYPDNANVYLARSYRETYVGRMLDAVNDGAHAVQLDPLSPAKLENLVLVYAYSGNADTAYSDLSKAEQLWPQAPTLVYARYGLDVRFGDPKEALKLLQDPSLQGPLQAEASMFLRARIDPTPKNIGQSVAEDRKVFQQYPQFSGQIVQTLAQFGRKDEVLSILLNYAGGAYFAGENAEVLFRPAMRQVWRDPRSIAAAAHWGLLHYWNASGHWPDFCSDPTLPYDCKKEAAKYPV